MQISSSKSAKQMVMNQKNWIIVITAAAAASLAHLHVVPAREHAVADIMVKHGAAEKSR